MTVKSKMTQKPQEAGEDRNMDCLPGKATGKEKLAQQRGHVGFDQIAQRGGAAKSIGTHHAQSYGLKLPPAEFQCLSLFLSTLFGRGRNAYSVLLCIVLFYPQRQGFSV